MKKRTIIFLASIVLVGCGSEAVSRAMLPDQAYIHSLEARVKVAEAQRDAVAEALDEKLEGEAMTTQGQTQPPNPPLTSVTPPPEPLAPPLERVFAIPAVVPVLSPKPGDVPLFIGFADEDPCMDDSTIRAMTGIPWMGPRDLRGRCAAVLPNRMMVHVRVGEMEMAAWYVGGTAVSTCVTADRNGHPRRLPLVHPGSKARWVMPSGRAQVHFDLYQMGVTGDCAEFVRTVSDSVVFPRPGNAWGKEWKAPDLRLH